MKILGERRNRGDDRRRGAAMVYAAVVAIAMLGMGSALLMTNLGTSRVRVETRNAQLAFYAAEAGLSDAFMRLTEGSLVMPEEGPAFVGTEDSPIPLGKSAYWVEVVENDYYHYTLRSTGIDGRSREGLELILAEAPTGFFQYAAFGADGVVLDSNSFIDSYYSQLGSYESQVKGGNEFARENGHVGSNADIILGSNTEVHGDATPGPGHVVDDSAPGAYVSGSTEPAEEAVVLPEINVPPIVTSGALNGNVSQMLGPGEIHYDRIQMEGGTKLTIVGPAALVADFFLMKANTELIFDTTNGPIELYGTGNFELKSNSTVTTQSNSALDVTLLLSGNNRTKRPPDTVELSANSEFVGAIYAPHAEVSLGSNFNIFGSVMCGKLDLSSNGRIHFDEALLYDGWGSTGELEPTLWHRISPEQRP